MEEEKLEMQESESIEGRFKDDIDLLQQELEDTNLLYDELKEHFDNIKNSRSPGALRFISDQTKSLISLKSHKISLIKEKISSKKMILELDMKIKSVNGSKGNGGDLRALLAMINEENLVESSPELTVLYNSNCDDEDIDDLLDKRLMDMEKENKSIKEEDEDNIFEDDETSEDEEEVFIVVDMNGNKYVVNSDYEFQEGYEDPDFEVKYDEDEEGNIIAYDDDGNQYEIIEI